MPGGPSIQFRPEAAGVEPLHQLAHGLFIDPFALAGFPFSFLVALLVPPFLRPIARGPALALHLLFLEPALI